MNNSKVKISFGIIVLNGEPFTKYCLRSLYDFAHEIIIVEGATKNAKAISTPEGHSKDSTLKSINEFIREEDKEKKVKLITRNGYFEGKNEMSIAYAEVATGNYLWQIDIDEFYLKEDMQKIVSLLEKDPSITAISFKTMPFWGSVDYIEEGPILGDFHRLFKFGPGYKYIEHRPPTVLDNNGNNLRNLKHLDGTTMAGHYGIYLYHYYLIFPLQAKVKTAYYSQTFHKDYYKWLNDNYINFKDPYHVNDNFWKISWLRKYKGSHPEQIVKMIDDIKTGKINAEMRENHDIDKVLNSFKYRTVTLILRIYFGLLSRIKRCIKKVLWSFNIRKTLKMPRFIKKTLKNSVLFPALRLRRPSRSQVLPAPSIR